MMRLYSLLCLLSFAAAAQFAQPLPVAMADSVTRYCLVERPGYRLLGGLCSVGPRLSGSPNTARAVQWVKSVLDTMGLDSVWLQPVLVPRWERGAVETAYYTVPGGKVVPLRIASLGGSVAAGSGTVPLTAGVVEVSSFDELAARKDEVKGKIVFFNRYFDHTQVTTFPAYGKGVAYRVWGAVEAARYGAVGMLLRPVTSLEDNVPHVGVMAYNDSLPRIPAAALGTSDANRLSRALRQDPALMVSMLFNAVTFPDAPSHNIIAEIRGSEYPDSVVMVSGHFDSWDVGDGAHDDGAGCMQSVEVMWLFKKFGIRPRYTLRCVLYMNEENGSRGAEEYAAWSLTQGEYHIAAIESDRGAFTPRGFNVERDTSVLRGMQQWLPLLNRSEIEWVRHGGSGADIARLKNARVLLGYVPDSQRYFDFHHSANDVFEAVNPRELELGSAAIFTMACLLSTLGLP